MNNVKDRTIEFIKAKGLSMKAFEQKCGLSTGYVTSMRKSFGSDKLNNVLTTFPDLNRDWLLYGEGSMLKSPDGVVARKSFEQGVPYYNVDFIGGFDLVDNDQSATPEYLIDYAPYNKATCWCNITGHSMEPEISHGDMLALKKVEDASFLPFGEVYAIVTTNDMRTVKRIGPASTPDAYALIPSNKSPEYGVQELPKAMIRTVFQVLGCMKRL